MKVGVIGAGVMGSDIGCMFSNAGHKVTLVDVSESALIGAISNLDESISQLEEVGVLEEDVKDNLCFTESQKFIRDSEFVIEAITEELEAKRSLMDSLEETVSEDCVIATNSSSYTVSEITQEMDHPGRTVLMHFSNPPILRDFVEIAKGKNTSEETLEFALDRAEEIDKTPVIPKEECRGYILNRLLGAGFVSTGYLHIEGAEIEKIDTTLRTMGNPHGMFELMDLIGLDLAIKVRENFREAYGERFEIPEEFQEKVTKMIEEGKLGKKSGVGFYEWKNGEPQYEEKMQGYDLTSVLGPVVNEAYRLVEEGIADKEDVEKTFKLASGSPTGIFGLGEIAGYELILVRLKALNQKFDNELFEPTESLRKAAD